MLIHINSLNHILYDFIINEALPKYENIWRANGDNSFTVDGKLFLFASTAKLMLKNNFIEKYPIIKTLTNKDGFIDIDEVKQVVLETLNEFKSKNKKLVIPVIDWEVDDADIEKIYEISKKFEAKEAYGRD